MGSGLNILLLRLKVGKAKVGKWKNPITYQK